jgi:diguanylate cyclase (GGDEF)-like protein
LWVLAYVQMNVFGILILLSFWLNQRKAGGLSLDDRLFSGMLIAAILEQVMDAAQWALDGSMIPGAYAMQIIVYSLGYAVAPTITCLWVMYCDLRVNMDEHGLKKRVPLYLLPLAINTLLLIANLFTPLVFTVDSAHLYHRERFFALYMVLMYLYGIYSMLLVLRKATQSNASMERTEFRYMAIFIIPPLFAGILQWLYYGLSLIWISVVLSIILVYTNVLSRQILTDPLTGLYNRRKLNYYLGMQINSAENNRTLFLMILDADGFKGINDNYGHSAGDRALVAIAEILRKLCSGQDCFLARMGGDEFLIVGHDQEDLHPALLARRIEQEASAFNAVTEEPYRLSLSVGWSHFQPESVNTIDALLNAADQSMYREKRAKRENAPNDGR